uniref:Uncharacterized protein n=1 Tax=Glossina palpalis gambiensis TaxID=67801 RepID=A0A1B0B0S8_9MUSC
MNNVLCVFSPTSGTREKSFDFNDFSKPSDFWNRILDGESSTLLDLFEMLMLELRPLCERFHAYIKDQTRQNYSSSLILFNKPYPQHLAEMFISNA